MTNANRIPPTRKIAWSKIGLNVFSPAKASVLLAENSAKTATAMRSAKITQ
jgi:hypothetical protein